MKPAIGRWLMRASPMVLAVYAPLAMLASNLAEVSPSDATRAVLASAGLGIAITALFLLVVRKTETAVVLAGAAVLAYFTYGHVYEGLRQLGPTGLLVGRHRYLVALDALLFLALAFLLVRRPSVAPTLARWLTVSVWILILLPVATLVQERTEEWRSRSAPDPLALTDLRAPEQDPPDVFYLILDGYGRSDVLRDRYGYDNTAFLDFLRSRGFFVADQAMSNYSYTLLSLSSSLNMDYLDQLLGEEGPTANDAGPLYDLVHRSRVMRAFRRLGYSMVAFETGVRQTELTNADIYLAPPSPQAGSAPSFLGQPGLNEFEGLFLETTMATVAFDFNPQDAQRRLAELSKSEFDDHRRRVRYTISTLSDIVGEPGAHFVFAHVLSPHPPFVFGPGGEALDPYGLFTLRDGCCIPRNYRTRYAGQLQYLNGILTDEIDEILGAADGNVVIILQGDHGPAGLLDWKKPEAGAIRDRMGILSAYYLPGSEPAELYPSISPVNTFRVVFDRYFSGEFDILDDVSYFTPTLDLSDRIEVAPFP